MSKKPVFYRDTWIEVDLDAIASNVWALAALYQQQERPTNIMAVVKANGYGHGAFAVAKTALAAGASHLGVALLEEALALREQGIEAPILVMGKIRAEDALVARKHRIAVTVCERYWLEEAARHMEAVSELEPLRIHVKVDTGMGRLGVQTAEEAVQLGAQIRSYTGMTLEGLFTHFATADEIDTSYFQMQLQRFQECLTKIKQAGLSISQIHCGNSAAALRFPAHMLSMVRFGIAMYGLTPSPEMESELPFPLKPALSLKCKLSFVKEIAAGEAVSYGATYRAPTRVIVGTLPIGYADGWLRSQSTTGGYALINGEEAPFLGRICMDQCMIALPKHVPPGTEVTLIGESAGACVSIDDIAKRLNTINYEIPCLLTSRIPRLYVKNGKICLIGEDA